MGNCRVLDRLIPKMSKVVRVISLTNNASLACFCCVSYSVVGIREEREQNPSFKFFPKPWM